MLYLNDIERKNHMSRSCITDFLSRSKLPLFVCALGMLILSACLPVPDATKITTPVTKITTPGATKVAKPVPTPTALPAPKAATPQCKPGHQAGFLRTFQSEVVDATSGCQVSLTGVNWFGFETSSFVPHGLAVRNYQDMLNQMAHLGFNTLRLPYTNQLFDPASQPQGINYQLNPDLKGLQGLALLDRIIQGARKAGLKVVLDRHDPSADQLTALWYTNQIPQSRWIQDWVMLAQHYRGNTTVVGADL